MPLLTKERVAELKQRHAKLHDECRETVERAEKEDRAFTPAEQERRGVAIAEMDALAQRISSIDRELANEGIGGHDGTRASQPLPHEDPAAVGTRHKYSFMKAVRQLASKGAEPFDGLEKEVSDEIARRTGKAPQGFMMPYRTSGQKGFEHIQRERERLAGLSPERRNLDSAAGAGSVPTILDKDWIELLRNKMRVKEAGAREIMDLQGKFAIPRQSAASTAYWVAESGSPIGSNQTLDQVPFTPHTIGAYTDISRRFFELTILESGEEFVKEDLTAVIARGVDLAAINGPGSSNQPLGIMQNTGITAGRTVALGTNGGAPTWQTLIELHTIVARGNAADLGEFVYMSNADVEGTLATTTKIVSPTYPIFLLEDGKVSNKRLLTTQQIPSNLSKGSTTGTLSAIIAGIFNQLVLAYWSGIDMLVDPYTGSSSGTVRIVALQDMDVQVRHNEAFAICVDCVTNQSQ
jgi:HK97 family phage major capsid protein